MWFDALLLFQRTLCVAWKLTTSKRQTITNKRRFVAVLPIIDLISRLNCKRVKIVVLLVYMLAC